MEPRQTTTIEIDRNYLYKIKDVAVKRRIKVREALNLILKLYFDTNSIENEGGK